MGIVNDAKAAGGKISTSRGSSGGLVATGSGFVANPLQLFTYFSRAQEWSSARQDFTTIFGGAWQFSICGRAREWIRVYGVVAVAGMAEFRLIAMEFSKGTTHWVAAVQDFARFCLPNHVGRVSLAYPNKLYFTIA